VVLYGWSELGVRIVDFASKSFQIAIYISLATINDAEKRSVNINGLLKRLSICIFPVQRTGTFTSLIIKKIRFPWFGPSNALSSNPITAFVRHARYKVKEIDWF
jgi:hypothetical protein